MADMWHIFMLRCAIQFTHEKREKLCETFVPFEYFCYFFCAELSKYHHHIRTNSLIARPFCNPLVSSNKCYCSLSFDEDEERGWEAWGKAKKKRIDGNKFFIYSLTLEPLKNTSENEKIANKFEMENLLIMSTVFSMRFITQKCARFQANVEQASASARSTKKLIS